jgi:hypothetical protein
LIRSIDLSYNKLGDSGLINLARAIETNQLPALRHLLLREVGAGAHSIERLLNSIQNGSLLETLDISGNVLFPSRSKKDKSGYSPKSIKKKLMQLTGELTPQISSAVKSFSGALSTHLNSATVLLEERKTALLALTQAPPKAYNTKGRKGRKEKGKGSKAGGGVGLGKGAKKRAKGTKGKVEKEGKEGKVGKEEKEGKGKQAREIEDDSDEDRVEDTSGTSSSPSASTPLRKKGSPASASASSEGKGKTSASASASKVASKVASSKSSKSSALIRRAGKGTKGAPPVPAAVMFSEEKLLQRSRVRALRALVRACGKAGGLRTLGLARVGLVDSASLLLTRVVEKDREKEEAKDKDQNKDQESRVKGQEKNQSKESNKGVKASPIAQMKKSLVESIVDMSGSPDVIKTLFDATTATDSEVDTKLYKNLRKTDPVAEAEAAAKRRRIAINLTLNELSAGAMANIADILLTT